MLTRVSIPTVSEGEYFEGLSERGTTFGYSYYASLISIGVY